MDVARVESGVSLFQNNPGFILTGLAELGKLWSLCTWGALILAAVAALGSLVRTFRKAVRRLRLYGARATTATGCGGAKIVASIIPEPCSVDDFSDDVDCKSERRPWVYEEYKEDAQCEEDDRLGCCVGDDQDKSDSRSRRRGDQHQENWGFGIGGWDSWFSSGHVVKAWEQERGDTDAGNDFFREACWGGREGAKGALSDFVPLIKSFCLEPPTLTLSCSDDLHIQLWDSRLRSFVPAAVIAPAAALRRRRTVKFGAAGGENNKVVYVAEPRSGGIVVDLRNNKAVLHWDDDAVETWCDADAMFVAEADQVAPR